MSSITDNASKTSVFLIQSFFYFALLSFLSMKENYKKDLYIARERKSECKGESKRVQRDRVYCFREVSDGAA